MRDMVMHMSGSSGVLSVPDEHLDARPSGTSTPISAFSASGGTVVGTDANSSCYAGGVNKVTQPMIHVWMTPVAGEPLTPHPAALDEVEVALKMPPVSPLNATA